MLIGGVVPTGGSVFSLFFRNGHVFIPLKRRVINIFTYTGNKSIKKKKKKKPVDNFR